MKYINILAGIILFCLAIPFAFIFTYMLISIYLAIKKTIRYKRNTKLLEQYGCERYMSGVPAFGNGAFYCWKNKDGNINISETDIMKMKYNRIKNMLKNKIGVSH